MDDYARNAYPLHLKSRPSQWDTECLLCLLDRTNKSARSVWTSLGSQSASGKNQKAPMSAFRAMGACGVMHIGLDHPKRIIAHRGL